MGCVHTHQKMPTIEGWGSPSCVQSVVQKIGEDNPKVRKINQTLSQMPTPRPKHDKIQAQQASKTHQKACWKGYDGVNVPRWNLKVEPFDAWWVVQMEKYTHMLGVVKISHVTLRCYWKWNVLLLTRV